MATLGLWTLVTNIVLKIHESQRRETGVTQAAGEGDDLGGGERGGDLGGRGGVGEPGSQQGRAMAQAAGEGR